MGFRQYALLSSLLLSAIVAAGCGDSSTQFVSFAVPRGEWRAEWIDSSTDEPHRHLRHITLTDTLGQISDTVAVLRNGTWEVDSTTATLLRFQSIGDGYQRAVEVRNPGTADADSLVRYWYFFRKGDSLHYYVGMRFIGNNPGLVGTWRTDERDSTLLNGTTWLNFYEDSVSINRRSGLQGDSDRTYSYHTEQNILVIDGIGDFYGDRFEIIPGSSLYISSRLSRGYAQVRR